MSYLLKSILIIIFLSHVAYAQNPRSITQAVKLKMNKVIDYKVDVNIKVQLPYISMMPINTKLYFKQKDKFKIDTKHIAIIPKQGFLLLAALVNDTNNFTSMFQSFETINNTKTSLINLIPNNDTSDVVLAKLWIDENNQVILKSQVTTKSSGTILAEYIYLSQLFYGLPDAIRFIVDVKKFKVPKAIAADINTSSSKKVEKKSGEIFVKLKNYQVNTGISDAFFKK